LTSDGHLVTIGHDLSGTCADQQSVCVMSHGAVAYCAAITPASTITLATEPGGSSSTAVTSMRGKITKSRSDIPNNTLTLSRDLLQQGVFCVDGHCSDGDGLVLQGDCTTGSCSAITLIGTDFSSSRCSSGQCQSSTVLLHVTVGDEAPAVSAVLPSSVALTSTQTTVPVQLQIETPINGTPSRGCSVTLHVSRDLVVPPNVLTVGDYYSRFGQAQMFVVDNGVASDGSHSYTVDNALLGPG